jgi:soluble cytochrome b562
MRRSNSLSALLLSTALLLPLCRISAADTPSPAASPARAAAPAAAENRDSTELGDHMDDAGDAFKKLRRQVADSSKNESSLELVAIMHRAAEASLNLKPAKTQDLPPADQAKFVSEYRKGIEKLLQQLEDLTASLKAGDKAKAEKQVKDLASYQREAHKHFRRPKD